MTTRLKTIAAAFAVASIATTAMAQSDPAMIAAKFASKPAAGNANPQVAAFVAKIKKLYPKTKFTAISATQFPGIYEVVMGPNIAYVEETGRYFIFGHLFDMAKQVDISEERLAKYGVKRDPVDSPRADDQRQPAPPMRIEWASLPLDNAVITVKGDGKRKMAVFSDPDCPYCKRVEEAIAKLDNVTVYTFMFPLEGLHPDAKRKSVAVWCSADRSKAWGELMDKGTVPDAKDCDNPIEKNIAFAMGKGISGTPSLIFADGTIAPGALPHDVIDRRLGSAK